MSLRKSAQIRSYLRPASSGDPSQQPCSAPRSLQQHHMQQAWQDIVDRDYKFAEDVIRARAVETGDVSGKVSDVATVLLGCIKCQRQPPTIQAGRVPLRNEALRLISFVHANINTLDREAHVWMTAVQLYDDFLHRDVSMRYCHQKFVLACYSLAFKYEANDVVIYHTELLQILALYSEQTKTPYWCSVAACPGSVADAELIVLETVKWNVPMEGTLVQIDNILTLAGAWSKDSVLLDRAYTIATNTSMDLTMLSTATYSPFCSACMCVQQACMELRIPTRRIFCIL